MEVKIYETLMNEWLPLMAEQAKTSLGTDVRFADSQELLDEFDHVETLWQKRHTHADAQAVHHKANEIAVARELLGKMGVNDTLRYEPPLRATKKSIDFLITTSDGLRNWIDVKTVNPDWVDEDDERAAGEWERFNAFVEKAGRRFSVITNMAGIAGQMVKTPWIFARRTFDLEHKQTLLEGDERGAVALLFCGNGFAFHRSDAEDFADFYKTGKFRLDDWSGAHLPEYMANEGYELKRTLAGFHYLERKQFDVDASLRLWVRGPIEFA